MTIKPAAVATYYDRAAQALAPVTILDELLSKFLVAEIVIYSCVLTRARTAREAKRERRHEYQNRGYQHVFQEMTHYKDALVGPEVLLVEGSPSIPGCT